MMLSYNNLPDQICRTVIRSMGRSSLQQASLLSKRWHRLVQPELFYKIDLTKRNTVQARLYNDFQGAAGKSPQGFPSGQRVHTLTCSFEAYMLDEEEISRNASAVCNLVQVLGSISVLELKLVLLGYRNQTFKDVLLPAIESFFAYARDKVTTIKLVVRDGDGLNGFAEGDSAEGLAGQVSAVLALFPNTMLSSLKLVYMSFASLPSALIEFLMSPVSKSLSLTSCDNAFNQLTNVRNLQNYTLRFKSDNRKYCGLIAGLNVCRNSAATLNSLTLEDVGGAWGRSEPWRRSSALALPRLSRLRLEETEDPTHEESLFNRVFSSIDAPMLTSLDIETQQIFCGAKAILGRLDSLTNIRNLKIRQEHNDHLNLPKFQVSPYQMLEKVCLERHISLECTVSASPETPDEMTCEFDCLAVFARTITKLNLTCQGRPLVQIDRQRPLYFPKLLHLSVHPIDILVMDSSSSYEEHWKLAEVDILRPLLGRLVCPNLKTLECKPYLVKENAVGVYDDLERVLQEGMYPSLESLEGRLYAVPGMPAGVAQALHQRLRVACQSAGVDYSRIDFIVPDEE